MLENDVPLISVVIPAYNAACTIERAVLSALNQTMRDIEVIVIDDGSTDNTYGILNALAEVDPRLHLIQSGNRGVAHARNLGIERARGTYIAFLDADDIWHRTKIEKQHALFQNRPTLGIVYCLSDRIDSEDNVLFRMPDYVVDGWGFLQHTLFNFVGNGSAILVPRAILLEVGGYSNLLRCMNAGGCEDYLLQLTIMSKYEVACVKEYLVGYRVLPTNMSADYAKMALSESLVLRHAVARLPDEFAWIGRRALAKADIVLLRDSIRQGEFGLARATWRALAAREGRVTTFARLIRLWARLSLDKTKSFIDELIGNHDRKFSFDDDARRLSPVLKNPKLTRFLAILAQLDTVQQRPYSADISSYQQPVGDPLLEFIGENRNRRATAKIDV